MTTFAHHAVRVGGKGYANAILGLRADGVNLVGCWPLNESKSTDSVIDIASGLNGTYNGTSTYNVQPGPISRESGGYTNFGGSTGYASILHDAAMTITGGFGFAAWVRPTTTTAGKTILCKSNTLISRINYELDQGTGLVPRFVYTTAGEAFRVFASSGSALTQNAWNHFGFTMTFGSGSTTAAMYLNGSAIAGSWTLGTGNDAPGTGTGALLIGAYQDSASGLVNHFGGGLAYPLLTATQLTAEQMRYLYEAGRNGV